VLPPGLRERALATRDTGFSAAPTRDAATVALLRDSPTGPEVYLLRRVKGMAFAGGMHVFPGGSVDAADGAAADLGWAGPPPAEWARALGCDQALARALVCAAVRETFEESGVLLAGATPDDVLSDVSTDEWEAERRALEAREQTLSQLLGRRGLVLRADLLRPLAHWITPELEPRRFDTRFFLARMPSGQRCRPAGTEAELRLWVRPGEALAQGLSMMPPTVAVLEELAAHPDVEQALAAERVLRPVMPRVVVDEDGEVRLVVDPGGPHPGAPEG
jgi:8-oxo-dGTP pyrophosphatase MutT (NUDIX family)